jgi:hypothetical protein
MSKYLIFISFLFALVNPGFTQENTEGNGNFRIEGYLGVYYAYDFRRPFTNELPAFIFNHKRHDEVNLNLGFIRGSLQNEHVRANLGLMAGTYAQYNLAHELPLLQHVYEANAGIRLREGLWFDAGIIPSFYGVESAMTLENPTLTRSLIAENSPYYLSGATLTYQPNELWLLRAAYLNGWQIISKSPINARQRALGTQIQFTPTENITLNSSGYFGRHGFFNLGGYRLFHNLYGNYVFNETYSLFASFDVGVDQGVVLTGGDNWWYGFSVIFRGQISPLFALAGRVEQYNDPGAANLNLPILFAGGVVNGASLTLDYIPMNNVRLSTEGKYLFSPDNIFIGTQGAGRGTFIWTTSLAILFTN